MSDDNLPANFAQRMIELQSRLDDSRSIDLITDLNELYRIAIDHYVSRDAKKAIHFQRKMTRLLADPDTLTLIQNKQPNNYMQKKSPQMVTQSKIKEEMNKYKTCQNEYIKNILEQSNRNMQKNQNIKKRDLNKQQQVLQNRLILKKYKSQQKFMKFSFVSDRHD